MNKICILDGDTVNKRIEIFDHQPDGLYIYRPDQEDSIEMHIYQDDSDEVTVIPADKSEPDNVFFRIEGIDPGKYLYDVIIRIKGECEEEGRYIETHHIITRQELIIKEVNSI